jgi:hypothetical protein
MVANPIFFDVGRAIEIVVFAGGTTGEGVDNFFEVTSCAVKVVGVLIFDIDHFG